MFGQTRLNGEDVFEVEERLAGELAGLRAQRTAAEEKLAALGAQYKASAAAALDTGDDGAALQLRRDIEKANVKKDGLDSRILDLEPRYQEAVRLAQAERLKRAQAEREDRFHKLVERAQAAAARVVEQHEKFMRTISEFDDLREELFQPGLQGLGGAHEVEMLNKMIFEPEGHPGLHARLMVRGWTLRTAIQPTYLEIVGIKAPPEK